VLQGPIPYWEESEEGSGLGRGFAPPSKLNIYIPVSQFSLILPFTSLRPVAEIWYRVGCNRVTDSHHTGHNKMIFAVFYV